MTATLRSPFCRPSKNALFEIDQALNRIKNGGYGICELTGKPIPRPRLDALPWTRFTVEAQRQIEREGRAPRARLGEFASIQDGSGTESGEDQEAVEKPPNASHDNAR